MNLDLKQIEQKLLAPLGDLRGLTPEQQLELIKAKAGDGEQSVLEEKSLLQRLKESQAKGKPLRFKLGIDPTAQHIHIGHAVSLLNLRRYMAMGHHVDLIIGDFTAMVGDPGGRMDERPALTREQVLENMTNYDAQAAKVVDLNSPQVKRHYNSSWLGKLDLTQWLAITKRMSVNKLLQREDFRKRLDDGASLSLAEFEYSLLMGYDSVVLNSDVEVGGQDQYLNFHFCRNMMELNGQRPEDLVVFNLLPGTTGEKDAQGRLAKMSKSRGNYIPLDADPVDLYGKTMSVPDDVMWVWFRELTEINAADLKALKAEVEGGKLHPKEAKHLLARAVCANFNHFDKSLIETAEKAFLSKFGKAAQLIPEGTADVPAGPGSLQDALKAGTGESSSQIRRLIEQKGIQILEGEAYKPISEAQLKESAAGYVGRVFKSGKLKYFKLV